MYHSQSMKIESEPLMMRLYLECLELPFFILILLRMSRKPMMRVRKLKI